MRPSLESIQAQLNVSRETAQSLMCFSDLLEKWTKAINLISNHSREDLWQRHIVDSAQVFDAISPVETCHWVDLGSGGGLPGAIVSIIAREKAPGVRVTCVESDQRKATFLRTVSRETSCQMSVLSERIEDIPCLEADVISARALTGLPDLLTYTEMHLKTDGQAIFPKGAKYKSEIAESLKAWQFSCDIIPSVTDSNAVLLKIRELNRV